MSSKDPPPSYEASSTNTGWFVFQRDYITSIDGILKIVQAILAMITFICSISAPYNWSGLGWAEFVGISAFITVVIYFFLYLFNTYQKIPGPWTLLEMIYYCIYTVFFFIAGCVLASAASHDSAIGAATFFAFAAMLVFAVDIFFKFRKLRGSESSFGERHVAATSTTTTTITTQRIENY